MPGLVVVQVREYRLHRLEVLDRGKAGFSVMIHPPANRGASREVARESPAETLGEVLNRAKAEIDAVMGPKPPPRARPVRHRDW